MASKKMVCPCLKVTKDDIINAVEQGASSFRDVKKQTRIVSKCGKCKDRVKCFVREVFVEKGLLPEEEKKEKTKKKKKKKKAVNDSGNICISCENGSGDCPLQNENTGKSKEDKKPVKEKKNKAKKNKDKKNKDKKNKDKKNKERKSKKGKNTSSI